MKISLIVACADGGVIGKENGLPWYLPADLAHFKAVTMGYPIIMGRRTHESIGRALPGRKNIVISRRSDFKTSGVITAGSLEQAFKKAGRSNEIFIIGGESIYKQALSLATKIYLTRVYADIDGDKFFRFEENDWQEISRKKHKKDDKNQYDYDFVELKRKPPKQI